MLLYGPFVSSVSKFLRSSQGVVDGNGYVKVDPVGVRMKGGSGKDSSAIVEIRRLVQVRRLSSQHGEYQMVTAIVPAVSDRGREGGRERGQERKRKRQRWEDWSKGQRERSIDFQPVEA